MLVQNRRRKRPERLASLDLEVEQFLHIRTTRIGKNRPVAQCAGTPFHPPLKPADHLAVGNRQRRVPAKFGGVQDSLNCAACIGNLGLTLDEKRIDHTGIKMRAPIGVIHDEGPQAAKPVPSPISGTDGAAGVTRR